MPHDTAGSANGPVTLRKPFTSKVSLSITRPFFCVTTPNVDATTKTLEASTLEFITHQIALFAPSKHTAFGTT